MLDKGTFGKGDIFRRIAEYLEDKKDDKLTAHTSWLLTHFSTALKEILNSNLKESMKVVFIELMAKDRIEKIKISFQKDKFLLTHLQCAIVAKRRMAFRKIKSKTEKEIND